MLLIELHQPDLPGIKRPTDTEDKDLKKLFSHLFETIYYNHIPYTDKKSDFRRFEKAMGVASGVFPYSGTAYRVLTITLDETEMVLTKYPNMEKYKIGIKGIDRAAAEEEFKQYVLEKVNRRLESIPYQSWSKDTTGIKFFKKKQPSEVGATESKKLHHNVLLEAYVHGVDVSQLAMMVGNQEQIQNSINAKEVVGRATQIKVLEAKLIKKRKITSRDPYSVVFAQPDNSRYFSQAGMGRWDER